MIHVFSILFYVGTCFVDNISIFVIAYYHRFFDNTTLTFIRICCVACHVFLTVCFFFFFKLFAIPAIIAVIKILMKCFNISKLYTLNDTNLKNNYSSPPLPTRYKLPNHFWNCAKLNFLAHIAIYHRIFNIQYI